MATLLSEDITQLLQAWSDGDEAALEKLTPVIYAELHRIAKRYMKKEHHQQTLQTSALVNEAYVRLIDWKNVHWQNRAQFFGVSAQLMRRILVDYARRRPRSENKEVEFAALEDAFVISKELNAGVVALDEALTSLSKIDSRKAQIVELKFFGGLTVEEIAEVMKLAPVTIMREWSKAKAWLYRELSD